jgi:uncharacterized protein YutE (UPF0331/DUF86 family)
MGVLDPKNARLLSMMAGYRNRMVHFYHEVTVEELYEICTRHLQEIEQIVSGIEDWIRAHPDKIDQNL